MKNPYIILKSGDAEQPFRYSAGCYGTRFLTELRDGCRLLGVRCPKCRKVYVPPRQVCGPCFAKMDEWVEVGPAGTIYTFTVLRFAFLDPETGEKKPVPYGYGYIRLDGADTNFQHFLELPKDGRIRIGDRVRAVFRDQRVGNLRDILHFQVLAPGGDHGTVL
jgi:uncharacterized OB-fold protein